MLARKVIPVLVGLVIAGLIIPAAWTSRCCCTLPDADAPSSAAATAADNCCTMTDSDQSPDKSEPSHCPGDCDCPQCTCGKTMTNATPMFHRHTPGIGGFVIGDVMAPLALVAQSTCEDDIQPPRA